MATINDIYGQIGAAKIFSGVIGDSFSFNEARTNYKDQLQELQSSLQNATTIGEKKEIEQRIIALKKEYNSNPTKSYLAKKFDSSTDILATLMEYVGIGKDELVKYLAIVLYGVVPAAELSIKRALLESLKRLASCNIDPRIPDSIRTTGIAISESKIDPLHVLQNSPFVFSRYLGSNYFGIKDDTTVYELTRAEDLDAFLWFAKHKAKFPYAKNANSVDFPLELEQNESLYSKVIHKTKLATNIVMGNTFQEASGSNTIYACLKAFYDDETTYLIKPVSSDFKSVNWYKSTVFYSVYRRNSRHSAAIANTKEKPLFNIKYTSQQNKNDSTSQVKDNFFTFKILPKPFTIGGGLIMEMGSNVAAAGDYVEDIANTTVDKVVGNDAKYGNVQAKFSKFTFPGVSALVPLKARFNSVGVYDKSGNFSIDETRFNITQNPSLNNGKDIPLPIYPKNGVENAICYLLYTPSTNTFALSSTEAYFSQVTKDVASKVLSECYMGDTIYEFNYDFLMSTKLFDYKAIANNIINALLANIPLTKSKSSSTNISKEQLIVNNKVAQIIQNVIDSTDTEYSDCFYTFSNEEIVQMENKTNQMVLNNIPFEDGTNEDNIDEIYNVLGAYNADSSMQEQVNIITTAFSKAVSASDNSQSSSDNSNTNIPSPGITESSNTSILKKLTQLLITETVNSVLTPKVLLLIKLNQVLTSRTEDQNMEELGLDIINDMTKNSTEDMIKSVEGIIVPIIKELIDMIQKELLRIILGRVSELFNAYVYEMGKEYTKKWKDLIKSLLECFNFKRATVRNDSQTDELISSIINGTDDSADLDALLGEITPNTNPC